MSKIVKSVILIFVLVFTAVYTKNYFEYSNISYSGSTFYTYVLVQAKDNTDTTSETTTVAPDTSNSNTTTDTPSNNTNSTNAYDTTTDLESNTSTQNLTYEYIITIFISILVFTSIVLYLIYSRGSKRKVFANTKKVLLFILVTLLVCSILSAVSIYFINNYVLNNNLNENTYIYNYVINR